MLPTSRRVGNSGGGGRGFPWLRMLVAVILLYTLSHGISLHALLDIPEGERPMNMVDLLPDRPPDGTMQGLMNDLDSKRRGPYARNPKPGHYRIGPVRKAFKDTYTLGSARRWFGTKEDARGYLLFVNAWAQWNNHRRQIIDAIAAARAMNRILVVPAMHHGRRRPGVFSFFDRREMQRLGPIVSEDEFFSAVSEAAGAPLPAHFDKARPPAGEAESPHPAARAPLPSAGDSAVAAGGSLEGGTVRCVGLTPKRWGKQVEEAGMRELRKRGVEVTRMVEYPTSEPYGGVKTTAFWSDLYGPGKEPYASEHVLCATYLFSQNRFHGEKALFAHIRRHMVFRAEFQKIADDVVAALGGASTFVSAHFRRGDHEKFCGKETPRRGCYPSVRESAARLALALATVKQDKVFLAHNANAGEIDAMRKLGIPITTLAEIPGVRDAIRAVEKRFGGEHRTAMIVDVLVAAQGSIFVANQWSTLSANVLEERSARGLDPGAFMYWGWESEARWYGREKEKSPETCLCGESSTKEIPYDWLSLP